MVNAKKPLSLVLALLMALTAFFAVGAGTMLGASAATGDIIYFEKPDSWSTVNCHVWLKSTNVPAAQWPGTAMTPVSGNIYSFRMPGDQDGVIFNNGNDQTVNLSFAGANKIFKPSKSSGKDINGTWSDYEGPTNPVTPTSPTTDPVKPTEPNPDGAAYAYLDNEAGWASPYAYYWKTTGVENAGFPGVALTDANKNSDGYYEVMIPANYIDKINGGIIFSNNRQDQSTDLKIGAGESMLYNNVTKAWVPYDSGDLKIKEFGTSESSPQYKGTQITIYANAINVNGKGVEYRFSVSGKEIQGYSSLSSVVWTPDTAGSYKLTVDVKDEEGNTNSRTIDYTIKDDATETRPVLKGITPSTGSMIKTNQAIDVTVNASGGNVGTNLLFSKVEIKYEATGENVNGDVYYTLMDDASDGKSESYSFKPDKNGKYLVSVSVQNSSNSTVTKTYELMATSSDADVYIQSLTSSNSSQTVNVGDSVTFTAKAAGGTQPYQYQFSVNGSVAQTYSSKNTYTLAASEEKDYKVEVIAKDSKGAVSSAVSKTIKAVKKQEDLMPGDMDGNNKIELYDAIVVQKYSIQLITLDERQKAAADMDGDKSITLKDAILIQKLALKKI